MQRLSRSLAIAGAATALTLILAACGGGGGSSSALSGTISGASPGATNSGTVTAFGSVFVNGHEFATAGAKVLDDDAGTTANGTSSLEVGMSVDVKASAASSERHPEAAEIHVHPLVRGVVDGSDPGGTLTVMGQSIQLTASTLFSDHRACVSAATSPCAAITGQMGLTATEGSGSSAVPGSYVTVYGFLFASEASGANAVATLVSVADAPASTARVAYKAEGVVKSISASSITIGELMVDLSSATCRAKGATMPCATAFAIGHVVSAIGAKAPALPATTFTADAAVLRGRVAVETPGAVVEVEGKVSAVTSSPASFVVRGITVDASNPAVSLPAVGDVVVVTGTVSDSGTSITATAVKVIHAARAATFGFEGDAASVAAGSSADTFVLVLLGESMTVNSSTRLRDLSKPSDPSNPFNISTFQTYLENSASKHLVVRTQADAAGNLTTTSVTIVPASTTSAISGLVDATPAPVNSSVSGTPTTFAVHGLSVSADPSAIVKVVALRDSYGFGGMGRMAGAAISTGDRVLVFGTFAAGTLTVTAPASARSVVLDFGAGLRDNDCDGF